MRLFVTGGCGFIGSNFIRYILKHHKDWEITNLDALTYAGRRENLSEFKADPRYRLVIGRIEEPPVVIKAIAGCEVVVNFAAETHVDRSIEEPAPFVKTNILGTQVLLDIAHKAKIARFIHISTDEVYGSLTTDEGVFTEETPLDPRSPYAASKAAADLLALAWHRTYEMPVIIIRPSNNYGPYQFLEKLIPLAITNLIKGKKVPVYGLGRNIRDWVYVEDIARAIETVLTKGAPGEVYNAGGNSPCRNIDLVRLILKLMGRSEEFIEFVPERPGHDYRYALSNEKIVGLGWQPQVDLTTGLERTVKWYVDHPEWWQAMKRRLVRESRGFWS